MTKHLNGIIHVNTKNMMIWAAYHADFNSNYKKLINKRS